MPDWRPTNVDFSGSGQVLRSAAAGVNNAAELFRNIGNDVDTEKRARDIHSKTMDEYQRSLDERAAKDILAKGLREGPTTTYADMDSAVNAAKAASTVPWEYDVENIDVYNGLLGGKQVYGTEEFARDAAGNVLTDAQGKPQFVSTAGKTPAGILLSPEQAKARTDKQLLLGGLLDKPGNKMVETQPEMYTRLLGGLAEKGYETAPYTDTLLNARALETTANKTALENETKTRDQLEKDMYQAKKDYVTLIPDDKRYVQGTEGRTSTSSNVIKDQESKISSAKGSGVSSYKDLSVSMAEDYENAGSGIAKLFGGGDRVNKEELLEWAYAKGLSPKFMENYLAANASSGSLGDVEGLKAGMLEAKAKGTDGGGNKLESTTSTNTDTSSRTTYETTSYGKLDAAKKMAEERVSTLKNALAVSDARIKELKMTPEERQATKRATFESDVMKLLGAQVSPGLIAPTAAAAVTPEKVTTLTAPVADSKIPTVLKSGSVSSKTSEVLKPTREQLNAGIIAKDKEIMSAPTKGAGKTKVLPSLADIYDRTPDTGIISSIARKITFDSTPLKLLGKDILQGTKVLESAGILTRGESSKDKVKDLAAYLGRKDLNEKDRAVAEGIQHNMLMQNSPEYRKLFNSDQLNGAMAAVALTAAAPLLVGAAARTIAPAATLFISKFRSALGKKVPKITTPRPVQQQVKPASKTPTAWWGS